MPKANEVKRGAAVEVDGEPFLVRDIEVKSPSARGASTLYKFRLVNARSQQNIDRQFKGDDFLKDADIARRKVQFLYRAGDEFTFMDDEDYSQFTLNADDIGDQVGYLVDGLGGVMAMLIDGDAVAIAAINSPKNTVISGETTAIESLLAEFSIEPLNSRSAASRTGDVVS